MESLLDASTVSRSLRRSAWCAPARQQKRARVAEHRHAHRNVANADAVVDHLTALPLAVPPVDVSRADLELERSRHAVRCTKLVDVGGLAVRVQIDEPGNDDGAGGVDGGTSRSIVLWNGGNRPARDADGSNCIQVRFGIEHTAVHDDDVVGLGPQQHHGDSSQERRGTATLAPGEVAATRAMRTCELAWLDGLLRQAQSYGPASCSGWRIRTGSRFDLRVSRTGKGSGTS